MGSVRRRPAVSLYLGDREPCMPMSATACRTSSSLNGLMTAVISFMNISSKSPPQEVGDRPARAYYTLRMQIPCQDELEAESMACAGGPSGCALL